MSRSYKKHGYDSICSSYGDKYCRSYYHRSDRRKTKRILKDVVDMYHSDTEDDLTKGNAYENEFCMLCMDCDEEILFEEGCFCEVPFLDYMDEYPYKDPNICHEPCCIWAWDWELEADKLLTKGKDYSLRFSEKWSWASDGGAYFQADLSTAHQDFDKHCLGVYEAGSFKHPILNDFYNDYYRNRDAKHNKDKKAYRVYVSYRVPVPSGRYNRGAADWLGNVMGQHKDRKSEIFSGFDKEYDSYHFNFRMPFTNKPLVAPDWVYERVAKEGGEITKICKSVEHYCERRAHSIWRVDDYALSQNIIPDTMWGPIDLKDYLIAHREEICKGWLRRRFGK